MLSSWVFERGQIGKLHIIENQEQKNLDPKQVEGQNQIEESNEDI